MNDWNRFLPAFSDGLWITDFVGFGRYENDYAREDQATPTGFRQGRIRRYAPPSFPVSYTE